ncbi:MAG: hypothetical protein CM15mP62_05910 [Rhodospirillaceae bacterium]|nr:MAG: hypothetical protein CM15mP62_05910 [Rhodospirillaceae bacterium]
MREKAISAYGCDIVRIEGNYDDSVRHADKDAQNNGWYVVSDTSYEGYREVPSVVMQGYTTIATEIAEQISGLHQRIFFFLAAWEVSLQLCFPGRSPGFGES